MQNIMLKSVPFIFCTAIMFSLILGNAEYGEKLFKDTVKVEETTNLHAKKSIKLYLDQPQRLQLNVERSNAQQKAKKQHIVETTEEPTTKKQEETTVVYDDNRLTRSGGVNYNSEGMKETYYNLDMTGVINIMRDAGFSKKKYPFWIRDDGAKMLGDYIMVAADLNKHPRGTTIHTSLGTGLVCDTGDFVYSNSNQIDIATDW